MRLLQKAIAALIISFPVVAHAINPVVRNYKCASAPVTSGSGTAYTCFTTDGGSTPTTLSAGDFFLFQADVASGANPTFNINGLGAKNIVKYVSGAQTNLAANDIVANEWVELRYDAANNVFQSVSPLAAAASGGGTNYPAQGNTFVAGQVFLGDNNTTKTFTLPVFTLVPSATETIATGYTINTSTLTGYSGDACTPIASVVGSNYTFNLWCQDGPGDTFRLTSYNHALGSEVWSLSFTLSSNGSPTFPGALTANTSITTGGAVVGANIKNGTAVITASTTTAFNVAVRSNLVQLSSGLAWNPTIAVGSDQQPICIDFQQPNSGTLATWTPPANMKNWSGPGSQLGYIVRQCGSYRATAGGFTGWYPDGPSITFPAS